MRGELGNQLGAIRVNLARGRMKDAVLNPGETFFSIGPQGGGHGVGSGVTQFGNLAMGYTTVFMPKDRHPLADDGVGMMIALMANLVLVFYRKLAVIQG